VEKETISQSNQKQSKNTFLVLLDIVPLINEKYFEINRSEGFIHGIQA